MPNEPDAYLPLVAGIELVQRSPSLATFPAGGLITTLPPEPEPEPEPE